MPIQTNHKQNYEAASQRHLADLMRLPPEERLTPQRRTEVIDHLTEADHLTFWRNVDQPAQKPPTVQQKQAKRTKGKGKFYQLLTKTLGLEAASGGIQCALGHLVLDQSPELAQHLLREMSRLQPAYPSPEQFVGLQDKLRRPLHLPRPGDIQTEAALDRYRVSSAQRPLYYQMVVQESDKIQQHRWHLEGEARYINERYGFDPSGYVNFMLSGDYQQGLAVTQTNRWYTLTTTDRTCFQQHYPIGVNEEDRYLHTYVTGGSGHGKSTILRLLIYNYQQLPDATRPAVILIDPHGDLAQECARFKTNLGSDRLVYINPGLDPDYSPSLNPLDLPTIRNPEEAESYADQFIGAFQEAMRGDNSFTAQMKVILKACLITLIRASDRTYSMRDLITFVGPDSDERTTLIDLAKKLLTNSSQREVFNDFDGQGYTTSRQSIRTKLATLLQDSRFNYFLSGNTTFNIQQAIEDRKLIIFDLSGVKSKDSLQALGLFVLANIQSLAIWRAELPPEQRTPTHVFIDEAQLFVSEAMGDILTQTRKFGIYGTFAQQQVGQNMLHYLKKIMLGNTGVKITGNNEMSSLQTIALETETRAEDYKLPKLHFRVSVRGQPYAFTVKAEHLPQAGPDGVYMSDDQWAAAKAQQMKQYYRRLGLNLPQPIIPPETIEPETGSESPVEGLGDAEVSETAQPIKTSSEAKSGPSEDLIEPALPVRPR